MYVDGFSESDLVNKGRGAQVAVVPKVPLTAIKFIMHCNYFMVSVHCPTTISLKNKLLF